MRWRSGRQHKRIMNWFALRVAAFRRWSVDILMVVFLLAAVAAALVLMYFAAR